MYFKRHRLLHDAFCSLTRIVLSFGYTERVLCIVTHKNMKEKLDANNEKMFEILFFDNNVHNDFICKHIILWTERFVSFNLHIFSNFLDPYKALFAIISIK